MIETFCSCGREITVDESAAADGAACAACGRAVLLASAEPLAAGMGAGDFDARLVVHSGPAGAGDTVALGGVPDIEVGKGEQRHVRLVSTMVSRAHARLVRVDFGPSRWKVVDTASTNGVYVNGERVAEAELADGDLLRLGDYELRFVTGRPVPEPPAEVPTHVPAAVRCPSCRAGYPAGTKICVACGIHVDTGRPLVTSRDVDTDELDYKTRQWVRWISWVFWFGLWPIGSEAFGHKKPKAIWWIAGITVAASLLYFVPFYAGWISGTRPWELWCGTGDGPYGSEAGTFHAYQIFTAALVHAGVMHLAGNMVFMLVFGIRVNELIGNARMAVAYPLLAAASAGVYMAAMHDGPNIPMLGASGAIMGLAGMYFVFFPVQKVVMVIWFRGWLLTAFQLLMKVFRVRGVWLLGLWVGLNDVLPTLIAHLNGGVTHDHTAHWGHIGGFAAGALVAVGMLVTRQVNAHGSDLLSVALGSKAWPLLGKPGERAAA